MIIKVNGKEQEIGKNEISVYELLMENNVGRPDMVSIQLNGKFVDKDELQTTLVKDKDEVDYLYFMGGG
ncbi:MAG: sulfur carrier protein ThiS [Chlorobi bacterium]|nr:sulfur carrier protein ThiS [Chlorobiota bacterium]